MYNKLNVVTYYGGKASLCDEISSQIEYLNSKVYIEMFGGGANILLNKPEHTYEIYNEIDTGVYTLFKMLSNWDDGWELYCRLRNTAYSRDVFEKNLSIREKYIMGRFECIGHAQYRYIKRLENKYGYNLIRAYKKAGGMDTEIMEKIQGFKTLNYEELQEGIWFFNENNKYMAGIEKEADDILEGTIYILKHLYGNGYATKKVKKTDSKKYEKLMKLLSKEVSPLRKCIQCDEILKKLENLKMPKITDKADIGAVRCLIKQVYEKLYRYDMDEKPCTIEEEMELAAATFIVFNMSRNGMGKFFKDTNNGDSLFFNKTQNLLEVIERMNGVTVTNYDCFEALKDIKKTFNLGQYEDEEIFIYFDPPYLKEAGSTGRDDKYNPGMVYKHGFEKEAHDRFLRLVQKLPFKMAVSNYRDEENVYDRYLNKENGWRSLEFDACTTIGGNREDRTEVLWMNY